MADEQQGGEEKIIAVARHIARTLGRTDTMADDILNIFSTFDGRLSREKLSDSSGEFSPAAAENDGPSLRSLHRGITDVLSLDRPIWSDSTYAGSFLASVDSLLGLIRDLEQPAFDRADDLLQQCVLRLEDEFKTIIEGSAVDPIQSSPFDSDNEESDGDDEIPVANPVTNYDIIIDAIPSGSISDLNEIAKRVAAAGFGREIAHVYSLSRRDFLDESLSRLGLRPKTVEEIHSTAWNLLEDEIQRWIRGVSLAVRVLFPSERRLCDRIFASLSPIAELAYAESCRGSAIQLIDFADAIAIGSKSPERLFMVVDMYEILRDLMPETDPLFADQLYSIYRSLGSTIKGIFTELENLIRRDPAKTPVPGGGLHPITRYVMNYLRAACASRRTLEQVMEEELENSTDDLDRPSSSLSVQIAWILDVLNENLESKSKIFESLPLSLIFLINNGRYIVSKVKDSELAVLMGEDWIRRQAARIKRWCADYQKATWSKVVAVIRTESGAGPDAIKGKAKLFNGYLEEIWMDQRDWVVADERLREEMRAAAAGLVVPAYRSFIGRCRGSVRLKFNVEDVEGMICELFGGSGRR